MGKVRRKLLPFFLVFLFVACATAAVGFAVENAGEKTVVRTIAGQIYYNGFYMPSSDDYIVISLVSSSDFELSSQKILNAQKFPLGFVLRYDYSEVNNSQTYKVVAKLFTNDGDRVVSIPVVLDEDKITVSLSF